MTTEEAQSDLVRNAILFACADQWAQGMAHPGAKAMLAQSADEYRERLLEAAHVYYTVVCDPPKPKPAA